MQGLDIDDFNDFFREAGELLNITIPNRFYLGQSINFGRIKKNFEAVIRGIEKKVRKENILMSDALNKLTKGTQNSMELTLDYINQTIDYARRLEVELEQAQKKIQELE